jgi:ATP-dependent Clp endopeptidase proteolytic subunit ClpP
MSQMIKVEDGIICVNPELNEIHFNAGINDESMSKLIELLTSMEYKLIKKKKDLKRKIRDFEKESETKNSKDEKAGDKISNFEIGISPKPIKLYITSHGGSIYQVFSAIDTIKCMKVPIHTICKGIVASAGTLLSLAGTRKFITENSYMLIHELRSGSWGKFSFIKDNFDNCNNLMEHIKDYYVKNTKLTKEELDIQLVKDLTWNAETCLEKGLVDEIIKK